LVAVTFTFGEMYEIFKIKIKLTPYFWPAHTGGQRLSACDITRAPGIMQYPLTESEVRALLDGLFEIQ